MVGVPGGRLAAQADGVGPPVVLVHAGIVDARAWDPLVPLLVNAGLRVIRYDVRNYGSSETESVPFSDSEDLLAVLDAFDLPQATLVGNSRGGVIAFDAAVQHPGRVARVVLLASNISGHQPEPTDEERLAYEEMERLEQAGDLEALVDFELRLWVDGLGQPEDRLPSATRDWLRPMIRDAESPDRIRATPMRLDPPASGRLEAATMPVLCVVGGLDLSDNEATARYLVAVLPNATMTVLPDVAHLVAAEAPERVAALIVERVTAR